MNALMVPVGSKRSGFEKTIISGAVNAWESALFTQ